MRIQVAEGAPPPLFQYRELDLETDLTCSACTLRYTIYGVFGFCPDCGQHNSEQILNKNLDVVETMLALADAQGSELRTHIIEDALENAVSSFDGFGREEVRLLCIRVGRQAGPASFQNLEKARDRVLQDCGVDMALSATKADWDLVLRCFQKRHLLAHSMGIVDDAYLAATNDPADERGRKVRIKKEEVQQLLALLRKLSGDLAIQLRAIR
jgi:hypothetical protein